MTMANVKHGELEGEVERLRRALDAEERRCREAEKQLDRASAEFEEFVSTAAHNLREPLRDVAAFSQLIAETYAGGLDPEGVRFLDRIRTGAARMQSLLTDVVNYWATGSEGASSGTDMDAALNQALLYADRLIAERGAIVTRDPLPRVWGEFGVMTRVFDHLIRNAVEYCAAPAPLVHISCKQADGEWVLSVADNGPGIAPEFQDRIFQAFKRLHGKEHQGNGLGLAFCKKAIGANGGRIWVESTPGAGSTFYFTVAAAE